MTPNRSLQRALEGVIFAFATDERVLYVFESAADAIAHCEGPDVDSGVWQFYSQSGAHLEASFSDPVERTAFSVSQGQYTLRPGSGVELSQRIVEVQAVEGPESVRSIEAVRRLFVDARPKLTSPAR